MFRENSAGKSETNQCKYRDCGLRKRGRRLWKTDDALALALPEGERDKMQFVKQCEEVQDSAMEYKSLHCCVLK